MLTGKQDRADDLVQSACLRALEKSEQFQPGSHFNRWMFKLTQRLWISEMRKETVRIGGGLAVLEEVPLQDEAPDPEKALLTREVVQRVMRLPEAQRATVLLVYVEGYTYREAADILDIPIGTVMSRLAAAREKLCGEFQIRSEVG